jgi:hypothetical protein
MLVFLNKLYHVFIEGRKPGTWCSKKSRSAFSTSTIAFCSTGTFIYNNNSPTKVSITYLTVGPPLVPELELE